MACTRQRSLPASRYNSEITRAISDLLAIESASTPLGASSTVNPFSSSLERTAVRVAESGSASRTVLDGIGASIERGCLDQSGSRSPVARWGARERKGAMQDCSPVYG